MSTAIEQLRFVTIPSGAYELGWRFTPDLPPDVANMLENAVGGFSEHRRIVLPAFEIATTTIRVDELLGDPYELAADSIESLCDLIDEVLAPYGLRLPTEDELEAAAGGSLFPWGLEVPAGIPQGAETSLNSFGLALDANPYDVEISRNALKFGDGGIAICGGEPWPMAWLTLSPSHRLLSSHIQDFFHETLETAFVRAVKP